MKLTIQLPVIYYASLLVKNKRKAQAFLSYCTTIATGHKPSARFFATLIGLSKSQTALWIIEFEKGIFEENRTDNGQSQSPISGTFEPQNNYIANDKSDTKRTQNGHGHDAPDSSNSGESDVSSLSPDTPPRADAACKREISKEIFSSLKKSSNKKLKKSSNKKCGEGVETQRKFQELVRTGYLVVKDKLKIELKSGETATIRHIGAKALLVVNGKIVKKDEALKVWDELYASANSVIGGLEVAKTVGQDHFVILRNGELFRRAVA